MTLARPTRLPAPVAALAKRLATLAALAVGVVGSVATSQSAPFRADDASTSAFSLGADTSEHAFDLELVTRAALAHTLTFELQSASDDGAPAPASLEILGLDDEPIVLTGGDNSWPSASLDVPVSCDATTCAFSGRLTVRVRGGAGAARLVVVLGSVMVDYEADVSDVDADVVRLDLASPDVASPDIAAPAAAAP